ncbi:MAG TPA: VCBS repeat-containing protein [Planctomycetes bacterium]|nr:VCBS repeat-containing protein [Planctomycetota bacterium]
MRIISIAVYWLIASGFAGIASAQSFQLLQAPLGISGIPVTINGNGIGCCTADFDGDGDMDVVLAPSGSAPFLYYRNDGGLIFTDVSAASGLGNSSDVRCLQAAESVGDSGSSTQTGASAAYCRVSAYFACRPCSRNYFPHTISSAPSPVRF